VVKGDNATLSNMRIDAGASRRTAIRIDPGVDRVGIRGNIVTSGQIRFP
jgi:hypothetical protein